MGDDMAVYVCDGCGHEVSVGRVGPLRSRVDCVECGGRFRPENPGEAL